MTPAEIKQQVVMLGAIAQQLTPNSAGQCVMITIPGTDVKHVYSNDLAKKIMMAVARTLEQERYRLINKRY